MSKVNQLLSKAMSTTSEDEAIACLRMARKSGLISSVNVSASSSDDGRYRNRTAEEWYVVAADLFFTKKEAERQTGIYKNIAVNAAEAVNWRYLKENQELKNKLAEYQMSERIQANGKLRNVEGFGAGIGMFIGAILFGIALFIFIVAGIY